MKCRIEALIAGLETGRDVQEVFEALGLTHAQAMKMLDSKRGRRMLSGRRRLSRIAGMLLAQRFGPHAIQRLCHLLSDEKVEVRMKGIITLLGVVGLNGKARNKAGGKSRGAPAEAPSAEDGALLEALAEVLIGKRAGGESGQTEKGS